MAKLLAGLKQAFKQVTNHPDVALIHAIKTKDLAGVKKAFARGADVNAEYNSFLLTDTFVYTPVEFAVEDDAPPAITAEILSHKPDLSKPRFSYTIGDWIMKLHSIAKGQESPNNLDNVKAVMESRLAEPKGYHLRSFLYAATQNGRQDLVEFFSNYSPAARETLKQSAEHNAYSVEGDDAPMAALLRAKLAAMTADAAPANDTGPAAKPAAGPGPR